jgi:hypothetical protein
MKNPAGWRGFFMRDRISTSKPAIGQVWNLLIFISHGKIIFESGTIPSGRSIVCIRLLKS